MSYLADTYVEHRGGGRTRLRCEDCGKVAYPTEDEATRAALLIAQSRVPMRPYLGDCGWWHVSRRNARRWLRERFVSLVDAAWTAALEDPRADGVVISATGAGYRPTG